MGNVVEKALIGVALVVLTDDEGKKFSFSTSSKVNAKVVVEEGKKIELVIKGVLKSRKKFDTSIKGVDLEFTDNMFLPEVVALLQGGVVEIDDQDNFVSYSPPVAGITPSLKTFNVDIFTEETDSSGEILNYVKLSLPNGKGEPVELGFEDDKFFSAKYVIKTSPAKGQAPYKIEMVSTLPTI